MGFLKCLVIKHLTPICTKISIRGTERNCRKEMEILSNRFVETWSGKCSGGHSASFPHQRDFSNIPYISSRNSGEKWIWPTPPVSVVLYGSRKRWWEKPLLPLNTSGESSGARTWFRLMGLLARVISGRCSEITLFWTSLRGNNRVTSLLCFNEVM